MAILGIGDFETGNTSQWRTLQVGPGGTLQATTANPRQGTHCVHCKINPGDGPWPGSSSGRRAKLSMLQNNVDRVGEDDPNIFYAMSLKFASNFPNPDGWLFVTEWHSVNPTQQGPPLGYFYHQNGRIDVRRQIAGTATDHPLLPAGFAKNVWHDFVWEVRWRCNNTGLIRVWHKLATESSYGNPTVNVTGIQTAQILNGNCERVYSMLGLYRTANTANTYEMWGDGYVVATTFDEAATHAHGAITPTPPPPPPPPPPGKALAGTNANLASANTVVINNYNHPGGGLLVFFRHAGIAGGNRSVQHGATIIPMLHTRVAGSNDVTVGLAYLANAPAATLNLTVTLPSAVTNRGIHAYSIAGGPAINAWDSAIFGGVTNPSMSVASSAGSVAFCYLAWRNSASNVTGRGTGQVDELSDDTPTRQQSDSRGTNEGTTPFSWTLTAGGGDQAFGAIAVAFQSAPAISFQPVLNLNPSSVTVAAGRVTQWDSTVGDISFTRHNPEGEPLPGPLWEPALNAVKGDGTGFLTTGSPILTGGAPRTIFLNCRRQAEDHEDNVLFILGDLWQGDGTFFQIDNALSVRTGNADAFFNVNLSTTAFQIVRFELHGSNLNTVRLYINGNERAITTVDSRILNTNSGPSGLLGRLHTNVPQVRSSAWIRAVRVYNGVPTPAQAAAVEQELMAITADTPVIDPIANVSVIAGQTVQFNIIASSNTAPPTVTVERQNPELPLPSNIALGEPEINGNQVIRLFTWPTTPQATLGNYHLRARATLPNGISGERDFTVSITADTLTMGPVSNVTAFRGQNVQFNIVASANATPPTITLERQNPELPMPPGLTLGAPQTSGFQTTRQLSWTGTQNNGAGTYLLRARATVPSTTDQIRDFSIVLNNDPPVVNDIANITATAGEPVQFTIVASGQASVPTISLRRQDDTPAPAGITLGTPVVSGFQSTRQATWNTALGDEGTYHLKGVGTIHGIEGSKDFTLALGTFIDTPTINPIANVSTVEGQTISFSIVASGQLSAPNIIVQTQSGGTAPSGIALGTPQISGTQTTRSFSWPTTVGSAGTYPLRARATINGVHSFANFTVTINEFVTVTDPTFTIPPSNVTVFAGQTVSFSVTAQHPDGWPTQTLTTQTGAAPPAGISFTLGNASGTSATYHFNWTPPGVNTHPLRITAEKGGRTAVSDFTVTVQSAGTAPAPKSMAADPREITIHPESREIEVRGN